MADEKRASESKSGNSGLDVYLESSEKNERSGENVRKTVSLAAAGATLIPFASSKIVVLGKNDFVLDRLVDVFVISKHLFGGF